MRFHRLKCWPKYFRAVLDERKTCEVRKADRDYQVGDFLLLEEFDPQLDAKTGRYTAVQVTDILTPSDPPRGLLEGFVVMSVNRDSYAEDHITWKLQSFLGQPEEVRATTLTEKDA